MKRTITIAALIAACTGCASNEPFSVHGQFWHKHGMTPEQMVGERGPGYPDTWAIAVQRRELTDVEVVALDRSIAAHGFAADTQQLTRWEQQRRASKSLSSE